MNFNELKPCPNCGAFPDIYKISLWNTYIHCSKCNISTPFFTSKEDAITYFNSIPCTAVQKYIPVEDCKLCVASYKCKKGFGFSKNFIRNLKFDITPMFLKIGFSKKRAASIASNIIKMRIDFQIFNCKYFERKEKAN